MAPAVAGMEARRTVRSPAGVDVVTALEAVVDAREVGLHAVVVRIAVVVGGRHGGSQLVDPADDAGFFAEGVVVLVAVVLMAGQQVEGVVAERAVVGQQLVERVAQRAGVGLAEASALLGRVAVLLVVDQRALVVGVVRTEVHREFQSVEPGLLPDRPEGDVAARRKRVAGVVGLVVVKFGLRVEALGRGAVGVAVVILRSVFVLQPPVGVAHVVAGHVLQVDGIDRGHELRRVPDVRRACVLETLVARFAVGEVGVHADLEPALGLRIGAHAARVAGEVGVLENAVFHVVSQRCDVVGAFRTAVHRDDVFGAYGRIVADFVQPVLVPCSFGIRTDLARRLVDQRLPRVVLVRVVVFGILQSSDLLAEVGGGVAARALEIHARAVLGAVAQRFVAHFDVIFHVDQVVAGDGARGDSDVALVRNADFVLLALLGRDDDDAVGSAGAVERTCRCVLEHGHRLDVRGVDRAERPVEGDAVDHV